MSQQVVPKSEFARHLRSVADSAGDGVFIVLTGANRPVMLRISAGEITTSHCRGYDIQNAIDILAPTEEVRYSFKLAAPEDKPPLIEIDDFLLAIDAYVLPGSDVIGAVPNNNVERRRTQAITEQEKEQLMALATEVIGPVASLIVEDALAGSPTLRAAIDSIRSEVPEPDAAERFVASARQLLSQRGP